MNTEVYNADETEESYDIIIVGAGPAGATFARIADNGYKILLLDGKINPKPCGGLLSPDAQKALARFRMTLPRKILVSPQIFAVKTIDTAENSVRYYQRMYLNLDREKFDAWLCSVLPENVTIKEGRANIIENGTDFCRVGWKEADGSVHTARAGFVIGADGANSFVRTSLFKPLKTRRYTAIQQWFVCDNPKDEAFYSCIFDKETSDCCSWSINKNGYLIYGGAFAPKGCREAFELQKKRVEQFGFSFGEPIKTEACTVLRPYCKKSFNTGNGRVFLIGEAAGFISPSSLEGISSAINTAVALNDSFRAGGNISAHYKRNTASLRLKLTAKRFKCLFMYNPFLRKLVMKSGISSIDIYK